MGSVYIVGFLKHFDIGGVTRLVVCRDDRWREVFDAVTLEQPKSRTRMETVSFRLDGTVRGSLEDEARQIGTSLNGLVSQIFQRHVSWGRHADGLGLIPVSKDLLRCVFQKLTNEEIVEIANESAVSSGSEHILFLFQEISLNTVLQFLDLWRANFDASQHRFDVRRHYYTVHHDVNRNYSLFVKEYVNSLVQGTIPRPVSFEAVTPNALTFSFEDRTAHPPPR